MKFKIYPLSPTFCNGLVLCGLEKLQGLEAQYGIKSSESCLEIPTGTDAYFATQAELYTQTAAALAMSTANAVNATQVLTSGGEEPAIDEVWMSLNESKIKALARDIDGSIMSEIRRIADIEAVDDALEKNEMKAAIITGGIGSMNLPNILQKQAMFTSFSAPLDIVSNVKREKKTLMTKLKKIRPKIMAFLMAVALMFTLYSVSIKGEGLKIETAFGLILGIVLFGYINIIWK